ncbi:MAG: hypothetical protein ACOC0P_06060, partial [Planctomycetota bacterium]
MTRTLVAITATTLVAAVVGPGCSSGSADRGAALHPDIQSTGNFMSAASLRSAGTNHFIETSDEDGDAREVAITTAPPRSLVLPTEELRHLLAARGDAAGFDPDDWEYRRNDATIGIPPGGPDNRRAIDTYAVIEYYDRISVYGDRPST